jgi:hypothetical protein
MKKRKRNTEKQKKMGRGNKTPESLTLPKHQPGEYEQNAMKKRKRNTEKPKKWGGARRHQSLQQYQNTSRVNMSNK